MHLITYGFAYSIRPMDTIEMLYAAGNSIPTIANVLGIPRSTVRARLKKAGNLRTREEGLKLAAEQGRLGSGNRGKTRKFSDEHLANLRAARLAWGRDNAKGISLKPNGYLEYTTGKNKGRAVHVVKMEDRIGRRLLSDECVHHIDGDKLNNSEDNLAILTRAGHARLHRREEKIGRNGNVGNGQ